MPLMRRVTSLIPALSGPVLMALLVTACNPSAPPPAAPAAPPPPEVGVVTVAPTTVPLVTEMPGRAEAARTAQVRARAAGIVLQRSFREGSDVKAGQVLFRIDPAPYQATLASARAALARAEANLTQARALAERYEPLAKAQAVSQQEYVAAVAAQAQAQADVAAGRAAVQTAEINLGYATVSAPIGGRIGRALVTEGALVGQGEATPLALIQQIDPIVVNFTQPVAEVLRLRSAIAGGRLQARAGAEAVAVKLLLEDGSTYPQPGRLLFSDLTVDATTGQVTLRAEVPNPRGLLLPGMYLRGQVEQAMATGGMLLPQQAVQRSADGERVLVVAPDGSFGPRRVKVGPALGGQWVVLEGLKAGEQVIVDGVLKLAGKTVVKPVPWVPGAPRAASAAASNAASGMVPAATSAASVPAAASAASR